MTPEEVVDRALAASRAAGADDAVVVLEREDSTNLRWAANQLTTNGTTSSTSVGVVAIDDRTTGRAYGGLTRQVDDPAALDALVAEAVAGSRRAPVAEDADVLVTGPVSADFAEPAVPTSPERLGATAAGLGRLFAESEASGREMFGFAEHTVTTTWTATTAGTRHRAVQPYGTVELNGKSHSRTRSAWAGGGGREPSDVDVDALAAEVLQGLAWQARRVAVPPGRHDTVLPPSAVADVLCQWLLAADARTASEGRGVFARPDGGTRVGERVTDAALTVRDDPHHPVLGTSDVVTTTSTDDLASVFDTGLAVPGTRYLDAGVLRALPSSRHTARLAGTPVAPFADNVVADLAGGRGSTAEVVQRLGSGLLLTCLWYVRTVDEQTMLVTGLTRDGVYVVDGGEVVGATTNFRFNDSPAQMLTRVRDGGTSTVCLPRELGDWLPRVQAPPLLVADLHLSSVSEAS
jgi:predicted Zn-dependent protease